MGWGYNWRPYVPVAQRRANALRKIAQMGKKSGQATSPVVLQTKKIASTFWGKAWCENLEAYSDFANRLPRGRTYVRNGSVLDLQISKGSITALVSGSELYKIRIGITPLSKGLWQTIQKECGGKIDSLLELLQGRLSTAVMQIVTRQERGLFPSPKEIQLDCSCPDWAGLCKHVAASLYGVGARLDEKPELLFLLRGVDPAELISQVSAAEAVRQTAPAQAGATIAETDLAEVFGIELDSKPAMPPPAAPAGKKTAPATRQQKHRPGKKKKPVKTARTSRKSPRARTPSASPVA